LRKIASVTDQKLRRVNDFGTRGVMESLSVGRRYVTVAFTDTVGQTGSHAVVIDFADTVFCPSSTADMLETTTAGGSP